MPKADIELFDDGVSAKEESFWNFDPSAFAVVRLMTSSKAVGCSTGRSAARAFENFVDSFARAPKQGRVVRSVRHKTSGLDNCGQSRTQGKRIDASNAGVEERARAHIELCVPKT